MWGSPRSSGGGGCSAQEQADGSVDHAGGDRAPRLAGDALGQLPCVLHARGLAVAATSGGALGLDDAPQLVLGEASAAYLLAPVEVGITASVAALHASDAYPMDSG
jgi:hypothetical protein